MGGILHTFYGNMSNDSGIVSMFIEPQAIKVHWVKFMELWTFGGGNIIIIYGTMSIVYRILNIVGRAVKFWYWNHENYLPNYE